MKRVIGVLLLIGVLALLLNDGGRWFNAKSSLRTSTSELAGWASTYARNLPRDQAAAELVSQANSRLIRVSQYGQDQNGIQIWTEADVHGTWVLGPLAAVNRGVPINQATGAVLVVKDYAQAQYR